MMAVTTENHFDSSHCFGGTILSVNLLKWSEKYILFEKLEKVENDFKKAKYIIL